MYRPFPVAKLIMCKLLLVCVWFGLDSTQTYASTEVDIATAKVPLVLSESAAIRSSVVRDALKQVLVKISGDSQIDQIAGIKEMLRNAQNYLRSYRFAEQQGQRMYVASFDEERIFQEIKALRVPLWGRLRSDTLVWFALQEGQQRLILSDNLNDDLSTELKHLAEQRGIPVTLPLMDLSDMQKVTVTDVWTFYRHALLDASTRYQSDKIVAVRLAPNSLANAALTGLGLDEQSPPPNSRGKAGQQAKDNFSLFGSDNIVLTGDYLITHEQQNTESSFDPTEFSELQNRSQKGEFLLEWTVFDDQLTRSERLYGDDPKALLSRFVNRYADQLAARFAVVPNEDDVPLTYVTVSVANLTNLRAYHEAVTYLSGISSVEHASLVSQKGPVATFEIALLGGDSQAFINALSIESRLQPVVDTVGQPVAGMNYFWTD